MQEQNLKNHPQLVPAYHFVLFFVLLITLGWSIGHFVKTITIGANRVEALMFLLMNIALLISAYLLRAFSLKAQDRAIRAEENLRHFALTGKLLDISLKVQQIVALRFASDDEFVALAARAAKENLSNKDIKAAIKTWRGDYYRV